MDPRRMSPVVIVPVLSRQRTSTRASTSTVESCFAKARRRAMASMPATKAMLVSRTNPSGTIATEAATVPCTASCQRSSASSNDRNNSTEATGMMAMSHFRMRLIDVRSSESAMVKRLASAASPVA